MTDFPQSPACAGKPDLTVTLAGIRMRNPVMVASGTFGYGPEYADLVDLNRLGAMVVKGILPEPWEGNPVPRMVEVPGGLVNAIGLQNPGVEGFVATYMPFLRRYDVPVIVNIWGRSPAEYADVAARLDVVDGISGLELNVSCPNVKKGGSAFGTDVDVLSRLVVAVRGKTKLPMIVKLAPNVTDIGRFVKACEDAGADAVSLINSYPALVIDVESRKPVLANVVGGLSGPAIHPIALKLVWEAAKSTKLPVIGMGGISHANDALEFLIAGASAVAVGTANFTEPTTCESVVQGIEDYMSRHGIGRIADLTGSLQLP